MRVVLALASHAVDLIEEDDAALGALRVREDQPEDLLALTHPLADELRAADL
jgi:hypothetical protein